MTIAAVGDHEVTGMSEQTSERGDQNDHEDKRVVWVHNEDNGRDYEIKARDEMTIDTIVGELYTKLNTQRRSDDRLRCEQGGESVLSFLTLTLEAYLEAGHCRDLRWLFAGGTGGA